MKLSKSLLSAMAVGIAIGATSCSLGDIEDLHYDKCTAECEIEHTELRASTGNEEVNDDWLNCPGCGMG